MVMKKINVHSKWMIFAVTSMANLGASFAINSLNLALPILRQEFGVTQGAVSWLILVYSLMPCCTLLMFGRMADLYGYKRQYKIGFCFFAVVSMLAPLLSKNLVTLIFFRAMQGIGYSMLISITQATVYKAFDENERGKALGINSVFVSVGFAAGPTLGGFFLTYFSWHYIFYFCTVFCILGFIGTFIGMENDIADKRSNIKMDHLGGIFFAIFIGAVSVGLNFFDEWGFISVKFGMAMLISLTGLVLFIYRENHTENPMILLVLFRNKTFSLANGACGLSYMTQQLTTYLFPFFLIDILRLPPDKAGLMMLASPILMMLFSPLGGSLSDKVGTKIPAVIGLLLIIGSCIFTGYFRTDTSIIFAIAVLAMVGAGNGLSVSAINSAILGSVPSAQSGVASGMLATARNIGNTMGTAIGSVMLTMRQIHYMSIYLNKNASYLMAQRDTFYIVIVLSTIAILLIVLIPSRAEKIISL